MNIDKKLELVKSHKICKGEQRIYKHYSNVLSCVMSFAIFVPRYALIGNDCPVLYCLSGIGSSEQDMIQKSGFQRFAHRCDMIVVCPDTSPRGDEVPDNEEFFLGSNAGFYVNATQEPWNKHYKMFDYITYELPLIIEENFPANNKKSITGYSMGGFGALLIGLSNPNNYLSISAFAPICSPKDSKIGKEVLKQYLGSDKMKWKAIDPCEIIRHLKTIDKYLPILIDQGTADEYLDTDLHPEIFKKVCEEINYPCEINMRDGYDHSYYFVQSYIMEHFVFHAEYLDTN